MKFLGNVEFEGSGHVTPDSSDIGDTRVVTASSIFTSSAADESAVIITGMSVTPSLGQHLITYNSQYACSVASVTTTVSSDLASLRTYLKSLAATSTSHPLTFGSGEILKAGVYDIDGAGSIAGTLYIDAENDASAIFVIRCSAAFSTGASAVLQLINGAKASNIFWLAVGAVSLGATNTFKGTIIGDAAIAVGDTGNVDGKLLSIAGAVSFTNITLLAPMQSSINIHSLSSFSAFTSLGAVSNTGVSEIYGDIGTNGGAITGFESSTRHGKTFEPGNAMFLAEIGIYQNGVLIPNSLRSFGNATNNTGVILTILSLSNQILTTPQTLDVRIQILLGSISIGNRIFSTQKLE